MKNVFYVEKLNRAERANNMFTMPNKLESYSRKEYESLPEAIEKFLEWSMDEANNVTIDLNIANNEKGVQEELILLLLDTIQDMVIDYYKCEIGVTNANIYMIKGILKSMEKLKFIDFDILIDIEIMLNEFIYKMEGLPSEWFE